MRLHHVGMSVIAPPSDHKSGKRSENGQVRKSAWKGSSKLDATMVFVSRGGTMTSSDDTGVDSLSLT